LVVWVGARQDQVRDRDRICEDCQNLSPICAQQEQRYKERKTQ